MLISLFIHTRIYAYIYVYVNMIYVCFILFYSISFYLFASNLFFLFFFFCSALEEKKKTKKTTISKFLKKRKTSKQHNNHMDKYEGCYRLVHVDLQCITFPEITEYRIVYYFLVYICTTIWLEEQA